MKHPSLPLLEFQKKIDASIESGQGNVRNVDFTIKKGNLFVDTIDDSIYIVVEYIDKPYTQPGEEVVIGDITVLTEKTQKSHTVTIKINYSGIADIVLKNEENVEANTL